ncbi:hypothetical protein O3P69_005588 [Scylla paramamosain]|uniref:Uncharacterized protein n=1 Tax=Scylla paramamosain TaxID=85552 RepID=A0AAW0U683_SCYPA
MAYWLAFLPIIFMYGSVVLTWVLRRVFSRRRYATQATQASQESQDLIPRSEVPVEQLDYAFVRECGDARVLEKVLRVLRSGEEGLYPHLIEYVEERLAQVKPESRLLVRPQPPIRPHDLPPSELAALEADLATWAADLRREEDQRKTGRKEKEEEEDVKVLDDDDEEDEEEEQILSPTNIPSDLPPLDNFSSKILLIWVIQRPRRLCVSLHHPLKLPKSSLFTISLGCCGNTNGRSVQGGPTRLGSGEKRTSRCFMRRS